MKAEDITAAPRDAGIHLVRRELDDAAIGVSIADTAEGLSAIQHQGCAAAIWRREPLSEFQEWIDGIDPRRLPQGRITVRTDTVEAALIALCERDGTPDGPMRQSLVGNIAALATLFAALMDKAFVKLRLEVVTSNACSKFHIDSLTARLICTYRGTGTQYGVITEGETPQRVFTVPTGSPMILRGTLWPQSPPAGVLHRSPPIQGTGEARFVVVIDPADEPDPQAMPYHS